MRAKVLAGAAAADCWNSLRLRSSPSWRHLDYLWTFYNNETVRRKRKNSFATVLTGNQILKSAGTPATPEGHF
jgi:hypothetical protein